MKKIIVITILLFTIILNASSGFLHEQLAKEIIADEIYKYFGMRMKTVLGSDIVESLNKNNLLDNFIDASVWPDCNRDPLYILTFDLQAEMEKRHSKCASRLYDVINNEQNELQAYFDTLF